MARGRSRAGDEHPGLVVQGSRRGRSASFMRMANPTPDMRGLDRAGNPNWKPGVSGNPSGLPKWRQQLREMFKERSAEFFEAEAMLALGYRVPLKNLDGSQVVDEDGQPRWITPTAKDCLSALRDLWDRGLGRPPQAIHLDHELAELPDSHVAQTCPPAEVDCDRIAAILQILHEANVLPLLSGPADCLSEHPTSIED